MVSTPFFALGLGQYMECRRALMADVNAHGRLHISEPSDGGLPISPSGKNRPLPAQSLTRGV